MKIRINTAQFILLCLILLVGLFVRYANYSVWPREGATFDEYAWPWIGMSIIQQRIPKSWSPHANYTNEEIIKYRQATFRIVTPYLEHPPLFGLISGGYAILMGAEDMFDESVINPEVLRKLSLIFGLLSIIGVYLFAKALYNEKIGLLSALLYTVSPSVAVGSRLLQNENFMIPVWLLTLYLLVIYIKKKRKWLLLSVVLISALMVFAKIPWFVIGASCCAILVYRKKWKDCLVVGTAMTAGLGIFIVWGLYWNWNLFTSLWGLQLARYDIGLNTILTLFTMPFLTDRLFVDGWIYFGWIAIAILALQAKKHILLLTPFISYFLVYVWAIPGEQAQGWYRYPFYPFLMVATAIVIIEMIKKPSLLAILFQFVVGASAFLNGYEPFFGISTGLFRFFILAWSVPTIALFYLGKRYTKLYRYSLVLWTVLFIILGVPSSMYYNEQ